MIKKPNTTKLTNWLRMNQEFMKFGRQYYAHPDAYNPERLQRRGVWPHPNITITSTYRHGHPPPTLRTPFPASVKLL